MSVKRFVLTRLFPHSPVLDKANWIAKWKLTVDQFHGPMFATREEMYRHLAGDGPIDFFEFGVAAGNSLRFWCQLNQHPESRFFGFDCFTGLPELWHDGRPKGTFSQNGVLPKIADSRVQFEVGLFQQTLPGFLAHYEAKNRLVLHNDSDLYSSTLYTLTMMDAYIRSDSLVIFDEFWDAQHEYRALLDYTSAYRRRFEILAATDVFGKAAVRIERQPAPEHQLTSAAA